MANWVSASTPDFWVDGSGGVTYLGSGSWECSSGPGATSLYETFTSPFKPDPYYYTSTTHYGIRLTLSWNPTLATSVAMRIVTNESGYGYYEQILSFPAGVTTNRAYLVEWTPAVAERILEIRFIGSGGDFGSSYGSTPLVSAIEVDTEGGGEIETRSHLYKHTGRTETLETVIISAPDLPKRPATQRASPISKGQYANPIRLGSSPVKSAPVKRAAAVPGVRDQDGKLITLVNPHNKLVVVEIFENGETRYAIFIPPA